MEDIKENIFVYNLYIRVDLIEISVETYRPKKVVFKSSCLFRINKTHNNNEI